jgi:hypothetical protein
MMTDATKTLGQMTDEELSHLTPRGVPLDQAVATELQTRQANRLGKATESLVAATRDLMYATWAIALVAVLAAGLQVYLTIKGGK